jgi:hypothetical protein
MTKSQVMSPEMLADAIMQISKARITSSCAGVKASSLSFLCERLTGGTGIPIAADFDIIESRVERATREFSQHFEKSLFDEHD